MIGRKLAGRYELQEKIGQGGMSRIYRGTDLLLNRTVAVKVLKDQLVEDADFTRHFRHEARAAARLSHPNIVNVYDVGVDDETYFIVMEHVPGENLKQYIRRRGRLSAAEAVAIARQITKALVQAHAAGVIHRDIKPQNIILTDRGTVKVTDFGIAHAMDGTTVVNGSTIFGSVHYFPPEQARGNAVGEQSDIYSLGIVLYEMVTGQVPFSGDTPLSVAMKHLQQPITPPRQLVKDVPEPLERIILKAVRKDPYRRYCSALVLLDDLTLFQNTGQSQAGTGDECSDEQDTIRFPGDAFAGSEKQPAAAYRRRAWFFPLLIIVLLSASLVAGFVYLRQYILVPDITVPDLLEQPLNEAEEALEALGLRCSTRWVTHDTISANHIVGMDPRPGRVVRPDRMIELTVSEGPKYVETPDLFERTEMEARILLKEQDLKAVIVREHSVEVPEGKVIRQVPTPGFPLAPNDEVTIYLSLGARPFPIDNLKGQPLEQAEEYLEEHGLKLGEVQPIESDHPPGTVIAQYPEAGDNVKPGQPVDLVISKINDVGNSITGDDNGDGDDPGGSGAGAG